MSNHCSAALSYQDRDYYHQRDDEKSTPLLRLHHLDLDDERTMVKDFWDQCLLPNEPCLVVADKLMREWPAMKNWVLPPSSQMPKGSINYGYLREVYGTVDVTVTRILEGMNMEYGGMDSSHMAFKDYLDYLEERTDDVPCLYLKDWHILRNSGDVMKEAPYETLPFFRSDWLNETCDMEGADDFRFCYIGPKSSWTPFHADVYGSFSWSVNIIGRKRWRLYPPGMEKKRESKDPGVEGVDYIEVVQEAGESLFVPSGWHHIVWNEEDTISINHNWFNGANICYIWTQLRKALAEVKTEIDDLKDAEEFSEMCQTILKANHGMDYKGFVDIILSIWKRRSATDSSSNMQHREESHFDLIILKHIVRDHLLKDGDVDAEDKRRLTRLLFLSS